MSSMVIDKKTGDGTIVAEAADSLFADAQAGMTPATAMEHMLIQAVKEEMLRNPPVRTVGFGQANRMQESRRLATLDVRRLFRACEVRDLVLVVLDRETIEQHVEKAVARVLAERGIVGSRECSTRGRQ